MNKDKEIYIFTGNAIIYDLENNILIKGVTLIPYYFTEYKENPSIDNDFNFSIQDILFCDDIINFKDSIVRLEVKYDVAEKYSGKIIGYNKLDFKNCKISNVQYSEQKRIGWIQCNCGIFYSNNLNAWVLAEETNCRIY